MEGLEREADCLCREGNGEPQKVLEQESDLFCLSENLREEPVLAYLEGPVLRLSQDIES